MAVLGIQIVITMVMASIMSKISPFYSFSRYVHPSDQEIKEAANLPLKESMKSAQGRRRRQQQQNGAPSEEPEKFTVPRNTDIQLETSKVTVLDVVQLKFYSEYQWLIDFALYAAIVYIITEIYAHYFPAKASQEVNLGMVWCTLVAGFAYRILISLNALYFSGKEAGERSLVIVMGCVYLLFAMLILIVDEDTLETGLDEAYISFNRSAAAFLADNAGLDSSGPASKLVLKFFLAVWCASVGALFTFPGLRLAKMQWDQLKKQEDIGGITTVLLHTSFIAPLLLTIFWVKPLSREYLTERIFHGRTSPFMTSDQFETLRLYMIVGVILFRVVMMKKYLQTYLDTAYYKMEAMKQEAGRISNLDMQRLVAYVFYYLCVVTLQYLAPMILILFLALMYKTMGGGSWTGLWSPRVPQTFEAPDLSKEARLPLDETLQAVTGQFSFAWQSLKEVFNPAVFRGLLGFSTWWCCLTWFVSSGIGIIYQSYFANVE